MRALDARVTDMPANSTAKRAQIHRNDVRVSSPDRCDLLCPRPGRRRATSQKSTLTRSGRNHGWKARALTHPTRVTLAAALLEANELRVCDLAWIRRPLADTRVPPRASATHTLTTT